MRYREKYAPTPQICTTTESPPTPACPTLPQAHNRPAQPRALSMRVSQRGSSAATTAPHGTVHALRTAVGAERPGDAAAGRAMRATRCAGWPGAHAGGPAGRGAPTPAHPAPLPHRAPAAAQHTTTTPPRPPHGTAGSRRGRQLVCVTCGLWSVTEPLPPIGCNQTPLKLQPPINGGRFGNVEWAAAAAARPDAASSTPPAGLVLLPSAFAGLVFDAFA